LQFKSLQRVLIYKEEARDGLFDLRQPPKVGMVLIPAQNGKYKLNMLQKNSFFKLPNQQLKTTVEHIYSLTFSVFVMMMSMRMQ